MKKIIEILYVYILYGKDCGSIISKLDIFWDEVLEADEFYDKYKTERNKNMGDKQYKFFCERESKLKCSMKK